MDTPILAGPWGNVTRGGFIMGLWLPPRLRAGAFPTGMKEHSPSTSALLATGSWGWLWEGRLSVPQFPSLINAPGIPVV